ncbi:MAG: sigma-70 family RNA polymerase sigma factor [Verrucomicrobia bacterium]|nr:sigma-70 family RNA polymerase sigma factor [Verrucomicrobiota bacterium]
MQEKSDVELLREYTAGANEAAFREIVTRHADLVYASALRQVSSPELARDIAQTVFSHLVRKAPALGKTLADNASLVGWLYRTTRYEANTQMRDNRRRQARERQAMENFDSNSETATEWERIAPMLDEAMADLSDEDRDALLLRFFKNHDFRAIGVTLGVSDDAAQKRVSRALERLRAEFNRRGVTTTAVALATAVSANAVAVGPAGLATTLSTAALAGTTIAINTTATVTKAIVMTTLQKTLIAATVVAAVGTGINEARQASTLRSQVQTLQQQRAPIAEQIQQLTKDRDDAKHQLAASRDENERLNRNTAELLRLRGQVGVLRQAEQENARLKAERDNLAKRLQQASGTTQAGMPLDVISFKGNSIFTEAELARILISRVGETLDQQKLDTDVLEISKLYRGAGYPAIQVLAVEKPEESSGRTTVTFVVKETPPK